MHACVSERARTCTGSGFPSFFRLWHVLIVFCTSAVSNRSPPKICTVMNHRPTRPLSCLWHRIEAASQPAGTARTLRVLPMLQSGNVRASYRSDTLDCLQEAIWCWHTETRVTRESMKNILCIRMRISTNVPASTRKTLRLTAIAGEAHEQHAEGWQNITLPMRPAHSIAFARSLRYSEVFAFLSTLSSSSIIDV